MFVCNGRYQLLRWCVSQLIPSAYLEWCVFLHGRILAYTWLELASRRPIINLPAAAAAAAAAAAVAAAATAAAAGSTCPRWLPCRGADHMHTVKL